MNNKKQSLEQIQKTQKEFGNEKYANNLSQSSVRILAWVKSRSTKLTPPSHGCHYWFSAVVWSIFISYFEKVDVVLDYIDWVWSISIFFPFFLFFLDFLAFGFRTGRIYYLLYRYRNIFYLFKYYELYSI